MPAGVAPWPIWINVARLSFEEVVGSFYKALYHFALSLTGQPGDASDLTQETFYIWATKGRQLRDESKVTSSSFKARSSPRLRPPAPFNSPRVVAGPPPVGSEATPHIYWPKAATVLLCKSISNLPPLRCESDGRNLHGIRVTHGNRTHVRRLHRLETTELAVKELYSAFGHRRRARSLVLDSRCGWPRRFLRSSSLR